MADNSFLKLPDEFYANEQTDQIVSSGISLPDEFYAEENQEAPQQELPIANLARESSRELLADPDIPNWLKEKTIQAGGLLAGIEQAGLTTANVLINTAQNVRSLGRSIAEIASRPFSQESDIQGIKNNSPSTNYNADWLDRLGETKEFIKSNVLSPASKERVEFGEKALPVALAALGTAGVGLGAGAAKGTLGRIAGSAFGGAKAGSAFELANSLMDENGTLDASTLAKRVGTGAAIGGAIGGVFQSGLEFLSGLGTTARRIFNISTKGTGSEDDIMAGINDVAKQFKADPDAKALHDAYREIGIKPTATTVFKNQNFAKEMESRARPLTFDEADEMQALLDANQAAAEKFVRTVPESLEQALQKEAPNLIAEDGLITHTKKTIDAIRSASYQAPEVRPVFDAVDSGIGLNNDTLNVLNQAKPTTAIDNKLVSMWQAVKSVISKGLGRSSALDGALVDSAIASTNQVGSHNNTQVLDALRKSVTQQLDDINIGNFDKTILRGVQKKIDVLMDSNVPGYSKAMNHLGTLDIFPGLSPTIKQYMSSRTSGEDVLKALFNPKTARLERREMLSFFTNGLKNTKGEMVIPGNPLLLKAAMRNHLNIGLNNADDLSKPFVQRFVKAFSNTDAKREMYNDIFTAISGRNLNQWTKIARLLDVSFQKHAEKLLSGTKAQSFLGAVGTDLSKSGVIKATSTLLNIGKQRAMFKMMWTKDWNQLLKQLDTHKSFGQQVNFLSAKLIDGGAQDLFDFSDEPALNSYIQKGGRSSANTQNKNKQIIKARGF